MALTPSQIERYRRILVARRDEFVSGIARAEAAAAEQDELGRLDYGDRATANAAKDDLLREAGRDSEELWRIEAAFARMAEGLYGICEQCGREIPVSRLDAVPSGTLCVRDQEISDRKRRLAGTALTDASGTALKGASGAVSGGAPSRVVL